MSTFYNEIDPKAAAWLRELIADGLIAPGTVDERDVRDIAPDELRSFQQCHFFAGIGGWSAALRRAVWADERAVWTVSCPCQPFSAAGGRGGFADERHLWPAFYHLASQCRPDVVLGEQVASKDGLAWFDLVSADMEAAGYSGGAVDLCSAGFGAPNIRQRLYFVWMADADEPRSQGRLGVPERADQCLAGANGMAGRLAYADGGDAGAERLQRGGQHGQRTKDAGIGRGFDPGPANGFWRDADWIGCTDGKWRPVEPGSFPLAPSLPGRVALLRGAGNAINVEVAAGFIEAVMDMAAILEADKQRCLAA